jgi:pimeloyl-ACP methyl ester carboxylesterase
MGTVVAGRVTTGQLSASRGKDGFLSVTGVRLHYVDWGGTGEPLLFLTGLGDSAHRFDEFASNFVDRFHVLGLTRRGQAESGTPPDGYDTSTLADDVKGFLDALKITRANIVGHSIAGDEMTLLAGRHPEHVGKLVYMDAAYDRARSYELVRKAKLPDPSFSSESIAAIERQSRAFHPDYSKVRAPALGFFVVYDSAPVTADMDAATRGRIESFYRDFGKAFTDEQIRLFRTTLRNAQVVELHGADHYIFQDPRHRAKVVEETRAFLLR